MPGYAMASDKAILGYAILPQDSVQNIHWMSVLRHALNKISDEHPTPRHRLYGSDAALADPGAGSLHAIDDQIGAVRQVVQATRALRERFILHQGATCNLDSLVTAVGTGNITT